MYSFLDHFYLVVFSSGAGSPLLFHKGTPVVFSTVTEPSVVLVYITPVLNSSVTGAPVV